MLQRFPLQEKVDLCGWSYRELREIFTFASKQPPAAGLVFQLRGKPLDTVSRTVRQADQHDNGLAPVLITDALAEYALEAARAIARAVSNLIVQALNNEPITVCFRRGEPGEQTLSYGRPIR